MIENLYFKKIYWMYQPISILIYSNIQFNMGWIHSYIHHSYICFVNILYWDSPRTHFILFHFHMYQLWIVELFISPTQLLLIFLGESFSSLSLKLHMHIEGPLNQTRSKITAIIYVCNMASVKVILKPQTKILSSYVS